MAEPVQFQIIPHSKQSGLQGLASQIKVIVSESAKDFQEAKNISLALHLSLSLGRGKICI